MSVLLIQANIVAMVMGSQSWESETDILCAPFVYEVVAEPLWRIGGQCAGRKQATESIAGAMVLT